MGITNMGIGLHMRFSPRRQTAVFCRGTWLALAVAAFAMAGSVDAQPCVVPDNGGGTVNLPPEGCGYVSPTDLHMIIDGLPLTVPPTTIQIAVEHERFFCRSCVGGPLDGFPCATVGDCLGFPCQIDIPLCSSPAATDSCVTPGGSLGGEGECSESQLTLNMQGTGVLAGFNRLIPLRAEFETHVAPRTPGDPVQSFDTDMFRMFGQITNPGSGDPDFDLLRIVAGTDFGMPSPGHTTLTLLPNGNWNVDSFFDIEYRIDFVGRPGGALSGMSGSTTGTIRMETGLGAGTCEPNSTLSACIPTQCPNPDEACQPRCTKVDPLTGQTQVVECDCRGPNECHAYNTNLPAGGLARGVPGNPCTQIEIGNGTVTLPPVGCEYLSPDEVHKIIDGLPAGTTIEFATIHKDFICNQQGTINPVCSFQTLVDCDEAGGMLGGEKECAESTLGITMTGTGTLAGFNRTLDLGIAFETHTAPRTPGDPVQSFDTHMFRLFGQISNIGDPDFDLLRIVAGTDFGMPSPGHTTLVLLPGNTWAVDSFFDIEYRIDFVGAPGGPLAGKSGSTTGTIRMQTGTPSRCVGGCPPGFACDESRVVNADGTINVCCDCKPLPPPPDPHRSLQGTSITFGQLDTPAIPAGFFSPGSLPFLGSVNFQGGPTDTLIQRSGALVCPLPPPAPCDPLDTEIVALDLVSVAPITVGGPPPNQWNVAVGLSASPQVLGTFQATKQHPNGGVFNAEIRVLPRIVFSEVGNPGNTRELDYGDIGQPPIRINFLNAFWVQNLGPNLVGTIAAPNDGNFVPGVIEQIPGNPNSQQVIQATGNSKGGGVSHPVDPVPLCPLPLGQTDPCAPFQARDCRDQGLGEVCVPTVIRQLPGLPPELIACGCRATNECHVDFGPIPGGPVCVNLCPNPTLVCQKSVNPAGDHSCDCAPKPPPDPHRSLQGTSITFDTPDVPMIPAGFFFPGSQPVSGVSVNFVGGPTDTLIQRSAAMVCPLPPPAPCDPLQTEIVALDIVSVAPMPVGGLGPNQWNVAVGLSANPQPIGTLDATKQHPNGGVFNAEIRVLPRIVFSEVGNPGNTKVLDYGVLGIPPIRINFINAQWVVNLGPNLVGTILAPNDGNFVPGVWETTPGDPTSQVVFQATGTSKGGGVTHPVDPVPLCPLPLGQTDPCAPFQARDCRQSLVTGDVCVPTIIRQLPGQQPELIACGCRPTDGCHVDFGPIPGNPICVGGCPVPTDICNQSVNAASDYSCNCEPGVCEPNATQTGCNPSCPNLAQVCQPKCAHADPATGQISVTDCDCVGTNDCHLTGNFTGGALVSWRGSGGNPCVVPDNGGGTVTLPPEGCDYLSPDDVHEIINGLPVGTTLQVGAIHGGFLCQGCTGGINAGHPCSGPGDCPGGVCEAKVDVCSFPVQVNCSQAGGSLGGEAECADSTLDLMMQGTGALGGYSRPVLLPVEMETHVGPRTPGNPVQSFDTDMFRLFGQLPPGDPDFDLLRIVGGTNFGLPSPGHTTLTKLPGGPNWAVDSFFDISYRIDFVGAPGGPFAGMSGSTTGTIRMATGTPTKCEGDCPPGTECVETRIVNADGTIDVCCDCVPIVTVCEPNPTQTACEPHICPIVGQECIPTKVKCDATGCHVTECECRDPNTCHIQLPVPPLTAPSCVGPCPAGFKCARQAEPSLPGGPKDTFYCKCIKLLPPIEVDPTGIGKNRYLSLSTSAADALNRGGGSNEAIRIRLQSLPQFPGSNGQDRWAGPPQAVTEQSQTANPLPLPTWNLSLMQCDPHFQPWASVGLVHIGGADVVPGSTYAIQIVGEDCDDLSSEDCYSDPVLVFTNKWGDVRDPFFPNPGQPNFLDIAAIVAKFQNGPGAVIKVRADLEPHVPNRVINFLDVSQDVGAFQGKVYPFSGPCNCPPANTCPMLDSCGRCSP